MQRRPFTSSEFGHHFAINKDGAVATAALKTNITRDDDSGVAFRWLLIGQEPIR